MMYERERSRMPLWVAIQRVHQACERFGSRDPDYARVLAASREFGAWVAGFCYTDWTMEYQDQVAAFIEGECIPTIRNKTCQQQLQALVSLLAQHGGK